MGASLDDWVRGLLLLAIAIFVLCGLSWGLFYLGITIPRPVGRIVGLVVLLVIVRLVLNQIFD